MDWNNKQAVLTEVTRNSYTLRYASPELQGDREVVLAAVSNDGRALEYASRELRADREVVLTAVSNNGYALKFVSPELRSDREVVLAALYNDIYALNYASPELYREFRNKTREQINELLNLERKLNQKKQSKVYINEEEKDEECPICLENYGKNRLIKLNCGHIIHFECWNQWKKHKSSCPLCRAKQP